MIIVKHFSKFFNILGQIMAFLTVILIGVIFINNGVFQFIPDAQMALLNTIKEYAVLSTLVVVGLSFASKRNIVFFIVYCVLAAVAVGFSFPALF